MGNKQLAKACEIMQAYKGMTDLNDFLSKFGRPDLIGSEISPYAPVLTEIKHVAERLFAARLEAKEAAKGGTSITLEDGREAKIVRAIRRKNRPLTAFVHLEQVATIQGGIEIKLDRYPAHEYALRPTKGWKRSSIDRSTVDYYRANRMMPVLHDLPKRFNGIAA